MINLDDVLNDNWGGGDPDDFRFEAYFDTNPFEESLAELEYEDGMEQIYDAEIVRAGAKIVANENSELALQYEANSKQLSDRGWGTILASHYKLVPQRIKRLVTLQWDCINYGLKYWDDIERGFKYCTDDDVLNVYVPEMPYIKILEECNKEIDKMEKVVKEIKNGTYNKEFVNILGVQSKLREPLRYVFPNILNKYFKYHSNKTVNVSAMIVPLREFKRTISLQDLKKLRTLFDEKSKGIGKMFKFFSDIFKSYMEPSFFTLGFSTSYRVWFKYNSAILSIAQNSLMSMGVVMTKAKVVGQKHRNR